MKKIISIMLIVAVVSGCLMFGSIAESDGDLVVYNEDTGNIVFDTDYPDIGKQMQISVQGREGETFLYKWFINNEQINNFDNSYTPVAGDKDKMLTVKVYDTDCELVGEKSIFISSLPVVYIETAERKPVVRKDIQLDAQMKIQGNSEFNDSAVLYDGKTQIKGRGNSTWNAPKKPYKLKLDSKSNLFGMGKSKHWVLLSNPYDSSNMRNDISFKLSDEMGLDAQKCVWVELVLNGKHVGIYQLVEHVRIEENRVNITDWDDIAEDAAKAIYKKNTDIMTKDERDELIDIMTENMDWVTDDIIKYKQNTFKVSDYYEVPSISGGYLLETSTETDQKNFRAPSGLKLVIDKPEGIGKGMLSYIADYYSAFDRALMSDDYCTEYQGETMRYNDFIDVESFAKGILINEIFENSDFGSKSTWMSKDIDGKLVFGPIWDMDYTVVSGFNLWTTAKKPWIKRILSDPMFMNEVRKIYFEYRYTAIQDMMKEGGSLDSAVEKISDSSKLNDKLWNNSLGFKENSDDFRQRLQLKINWLDKQLETLDSALASVMASADYSKFVKASDITLATENNSLNMSFASAPSEIKVFKDGALIKTVESPSISESVDIGEDDGVITVLAYDSDGNVLCGKSLDTSKYITSLTASLVNADKSYTIGEEIDKADFQLTASYSDSSVQTVTPDLIYTYAKDSLGSQSFCYGKVTDRAGAVYAVLMAENKAVEIKLNVMRSEDYQTVEGFISQIPADYNNRKFYKALFEAQTRYDMLSETAKAQVDNYSILESAMAHLNGTVGSADISVIDCYVDGATRYDSKNNVVVLVKGIPRSVIFKIINAGTNTYGRDNKNVLSIKKASGYELWTINHKFNMNVSAYDIYASYPGVSQKYTTHMSAADITDSREDVVLTELQDTAWTDKVFGVTANTADDISAVKLTENGAELASKTVGEDGKTTLNMTFTDIGKHTVSVSCKSGDRWLESGSFDVFVREPLKKPNVFYIKCPDKVENGSVFVKVITDDTTESVNFESENKTVGFELTSVKNGYKIWSGTLTDEQEYGISVNGIPSEQKVKFNGRKGDVNIDLMINSYDALLVLRYSVDLTTLTDVQLSCADVTGDGNINSSDALKILQYSVDLIDEL